MNAFDSDESALSGAESEQLPAPTAMEIKQGALYMSLSLARDCWFTMERFDTCGVPAMKWLLAKGERDGHLRAAREQLRDLQQRWGMGGIDQVLANMLAFEGLL